MTPRQTLADEGVSILVQGFPGKTLHHGGLGWSTIALTSRGSSHILVDVGSFGVRPLLLERLREHGLGAQDITHVLLTHAHWDHSVNWTLFPNARIVISERELRWALNEPPGGWHVPECYVRGLAKSRMGTRRRRACGPMPSQVTRRATSPMFWQAGRSMSSHGRCREESRGVTVAERRHVA